MQEENWQAESSSLRNRVTTGFLWTFLSKAFLWITKLLKLVIVAHFLDPSQLGVFAVVALAVLAFQTFSATGVKLALIRREKTSGDILDLGWTITAIRGCLLGLFLSAAAPFIASFFNLSNLTPLLRAMAVVPALQGFNNIGVIFFNRKLQFRKLFMFEAAAELMGFIVAVVLVYKTQSVWALVWARITVAVTRLALSYLMHPYRPRPKWNLSQTVELFRFGRWIFGSVAITFLATNLDDGVVGKILGAGALGLYQIAYRFSDMPLTELGRITTRVLLPAYAKLQNERDRLAYGFLNALEAVSSLVFPAGLVLAMVADELVMVVLGEEWRGAVPAIRILALTGSLRSLLASGTALFLAAGRPGLNFFMQAVGILLMAVFIIPLTVSLGIAGTAVSVGIGLVAMMFVWIKIRHIIGAKLSRILLSFRTALLLSAFSSAGAMIALSLPLEEPAFRLGLTLLLSGGLYAVGIWLSNYWPGSDLFSKTCRILLDTYTGIRKDK